MIQRIQSIWLLVAAICAAATLKFSFYSGTNAKGIASYQLNGMENILLLAITIAITLVSLVSIFLFKKRILQLRLCFLTLIVELLIVFLLYKETTSFTEGTYSLTAILHLGVLLFLFLAARAINKDEKLIKSSDRLR